jgi:hypothetical protein
MNNFIQNWNMPTSKKFHENDLGVFPKLNKHVVKLARPFLPPSLQTIQKFETENINNMIVVIVA